MFVPSFLALWWPKIDRKSGFPQLFAKTVGSIHFIPGIYTYGVSLWTPIDFRVRALIFGPHGLALLTLSWDKNWDSHSLVNGYPRFYPRIALVAPSPGGQKLTENRGFRNFSRKLSARFISSLGFILMG